MLKNATLSIENYRDMGQGSAGSIFPYQNSSKMFITSPSSKSVCDVTSGARELQVANLPENSGSYLVVILSER